MSYELLQRSAAASLPLTIGNTADINMLRVYVAARLVRAVIPQPVRTGHRFMQPAATLQEITALGRQALDASLNCPKPPAASTPPKRSLPASRPARGWAGAVQPA
ncbi:MAG: hypothetical protein V4505_04635 [Pseudomonadota bacterium]